MIKLWLTKLRKSLFKKKCEKKTDEETGRIQGYELVDIQPLYFKPDRNYRHM